MDQMRLKRLMDIVLSGGMLLVLAPLLAVIALLIRQSSPGPIFFRQLRVGRGKQLFEMIKFRTMVDGAHLKGPLVTGRGDSRITTIGKFLRTSKLDELPELWNVFVGDMSLVGPRPEVPRYVELYPAEWDDVFEVRPGVTDPATLRFNDEERVMALANDGERAYREVVLPVKIQLARNYVRNVSVLADLSILAGTVMRITVGRVLPSPEDPIVAEAIRRIEALNQAAAKESENS